MRVKIRIEKMMEENPLAEMTEEENDEEKPNKGALSINCIIRIFHTICIGTSDALVRLYSIQVSIQNNYTNIQDGSLLACLRGHTNYVNHMDSHRGM